jgi:hypothetical protein
MSAQMLVKILENHPGEFIDDREIADHIVSVLRCDNCKRWDVGASPGFGDCWRLDLFRTAADFFCAEFEEKS